MTHKLISYITQPLAFLLVHCLFFCCQLNGYFAITITIQALMKQSLSNIKHYFCQKQQKCNEK